MRDSQIKQAIASLEAMDVESVEVAARCKARMLEGFDSPDQVDGRRKADIGEAIAVAEIGLLLESDDHRRPAPRRWLRLWMPAAAAAAIVLAFLVVQNQVDRYDPTVVVAADSATDESARPVDDRQDEEPEVDAPFVDNNVPRLIEGEFSTTALGGTLSFAAVEPVWLTRHETGILELSRDHLDPLAAELVIARVTGAASALESPSAIDYLASQPPGVTGQMTPYVLDGVDSLLWRGRVDPGGAGLADCVPGDVCLVLYNAPTPIGLQEGVLNDVVERPASDGDIFLLAAVLPVQAYGVHPFETAFDELVATISFDETALLADE